ncbi:hypothetical protein ACM26V_07350 [Salipaludibacillus sp. HK11]|uniref:hypothetical protein n=1 Tax=Salipaludibacillus sp. HK11 TaxID=3394320 RepID=UPI0039FBFF7D
MNKNQWFLIIVCLITLSIPGCSNENLTNENEEVAALEETKIEETETEENEINVNEVQENEDDIEPSEGRIPIAALHNVEEIVKEKGKYDIDLLKDDEEYEKELLDEIIDAPDQLTGEEAYSLIVSLVAADIEEEAKKFEDVDPIIMIDSSNPEDAIDIPEQEIVNVAILLDASGSMAGEVDGGQKMTLVKCEVSWRFSTCSLL